METVNDMLIEEIEGYKPEIHESAFIAKGAVVAGNVKIGRASSLWFHAVVRGDEDGVEIGEETSIQEGCMVHVTFGKPCKIGSRVTVGHNAVIHGATIGNDCIIGISSTILDGAVIGDGCIVAAGCVVPPGKTYPPRSMLMGTPARIVREVTDAEYKSNLTSSAIYVGRSAKYKATGRF